ncbi:glycerate kinase type-2 family protein [Falsirhodobacter xinxiangensis]|uniref:glycerate kinase type-2 family protein n=1 Tax=Falsirhodobacter xinxiangensis TaxID=2530049 RepID=UPI0010A99E39|nr:glycerate kinase [Rhodobacter xinxiangensis]
MDERAFLERVFRAGIAAADPAQVLVRHLPERPKDRVVVVGAGKAAASMARAVEAAWPDATGVVVTRDGHSCETSGIEVLEASHPVPDERSEAAARRMLDAVRGLGPDDLVLVLISGGGSSLMALPAEGLTLAEKQAVNRQLLASGLGIGDMNRVRRRLSGIKGGKLALAAAPARVVTLAISDVPGDDPRAIASGPTVFDPEASADLSALVDRLPDLPEAARRLLLATPAPVQPFEADYRMIATPMMALEAAAQVAREAGVTPLILGDALEGESAALGQMMAGVARSVLDHGHPLPRPALILSGGETTVTIGAGKPGRGGRNTEFLLSLALARLPIFALAGDTDGIDGTEDAAGAIVTPDTLTRAPDAARALAAHDSYSLFARLGDLVITGPTLTNVNDLRAILVT